MGLLGDEVEYERTGRTVGAWISLALVISRHVELRHEEVREVDHVGHACNAHPTDQWEMAG